MGLFPFPFPRNSLRFKMFLTLSVFTLVIVITLSGIFAWLEIRAFRQRTTDKARILAVSLASSVRLPLFADDRDSMERLAREVAKDVDVYAVTIIRANGDVAVRAGNKAPLEDPSAIRWEAPVTAGTSGGSEAEGLGLSSGGDTLLGKVRVTIDITETRKFIAAMTGFTVLAGLLFWLESGNQYPPIFAPFLFARWLAARIFRSLSISMAG